MLTVEVYSVTAASPETLWVLVGDLRRLPEWTSAERLEGAPEPPLEVGQRFTTVDGDRKLAWVVITVGDRLLEAKTDVSWGRLGVGVRVAPEGGGSRLVLAGLLDPRRGTLAARLLHVPALRSRFDAWSATATRLAAR